MLLWKQSENAETLTFKVRYGIDGMIKAVPKTINYVITATRLRVFLRTQGGKESVWGH